MYVKVMYDRPTKQSAGCKARFNMSLKVPSQIAGRRQTPTLAGQVKLTYRLPGRRAKKASYRSTDSIESIGSIEVSINGKKTQ